MDVTFETGFVVDFVLLCVCACVCIRNSVNKAFLCVQVLLNAVHVLDIKEENTDSSDVNFFFHVCVISVTVSGMHMFQVIV